MSDQTSVHQSGCPGNTAGGADLDRLIELVILRLALAQDVAAAKYGSGAPIDDPIRELEILESAARALSAPGFDQRLGILLVRDQIEASKVISADCACSTRWPRQAWRSWSCPPAGVGEAPGTGDEATGAGDPPGAARGG